MKRLQLNITGTVQGVWYRKNCQAQARKCNLSGWVQNQADGSVLAEAQGDEEDLMHWLKWCKTGPEQAQVHNVRSIELAPITGESDFVIT